MQNLCDRKMFYSFPLALICKIVNGQSQPGVILIPPPMKLQQERVYRLGVVVVWGRKGKKTVGYLASQGKKRKKSYWSWTMSQGIDEPAGPPRLKFQVPISRMDGSLYRVRRFCVCSLGIAPISPSDTAELPPVYTHYRLHIHASFTKARWLDACESCGGACRFR